MDQSGGCLESVSVACPVQPGREYPLCEYIAMHTEPVLCLRRRSARPRDQGRWNQTSALPDLLTFSFHIWFISNFQPQSLV